MFHGMGAPSNWSWCDPTDPLWCVLCGNCLSTKDAMSTAPMPTQPAVPAGAYQTGPGPTVTGDPQSILNSIIDPAAAQDRLNIGTFFGGVNAVNQAGQGLSTGTTIALIAAGIAVLALVKH